MRILEGKSPNERNKMIAAGVLGVLALASLYLAFGQSLFGSRTSVTVEVTPTPTPTGSPSRELRAVRMPSQEDQNFEWQTTPVLYRPGLFSAPDPGRNIFAFYEPPPRTPYVTPTPTPFVTPTPVPTPTPPIFVAYVNPQSVYAGSKTVRIEVNGDKFTPEARIYFSQSPLATTFLSAQRLVAEVPANLIAMEGPRQIMVQTPDGKLYSNQTMMNVQAPPRPQFQYVGMIARQHANNDTAVFREQGKPSEFAARLNDVLGGRFRLVSISAAEAVFEDTSLGFRHRLELYRPPPGTVTSSVPTPPGPVRGRPPGFQDVMPQEEIDMSDIPGIPANIPRYVPPGNRAPQRQRTPANIDSKQDDGDEDTDGS
jgi:hypothetical protein